MTTYQTTTEETEILVLEGRIEAAQHQRNLVIQQGHNLDCIQCGFKDNVVERYLAELTTQLQALKQKARVS